MSDRAAIYTEMGKVRIWLPHYALRLAIRPAGRMRGNFVSVAEVAHGDDLDAMFDMQEAMLPVLPKNVTVEVVYREWGIPIRAGKPGRLPESPNRYSQIPSGNG